MSTLGAVLTWALFGLIVGAIARALYPGRQSMGLIMTMLLGIVGSIVGGFIASMTTNNPARDPMNGSGWIMSIVGALIVVWIGLALSGNRRIGSM